MRKLKLVPDRPFGHKCDVSVYDVTDGGEKRRCKITVDYSKYDVEQLKAEGKDLQQALDYYRSWIYDVVRINITDEWECADGMDQMIKIVYDHIAPYFVRELPQS